MASTLAEVVSIIAPPYGKPSTTIIIASNKAADWIEKNYVVTGNDAYERKSNKLKACLDKRNEYLGISR